MMNDLQVAAIVAAILYKRCYDKDTDAADAVERAQALIQALKDAE